MRTLAKLNILIIVAALTVFFQPKKAASSDKESVTLKSLIDEAIENSPRIKQARYNWSAAIEKIPQVGALPDPMISFTYFPEPIETRLGPNNARVMFSQKLPYLKKLDVKEDIATKDIMIAKFTFDRDVKRVVTDLMQSYFELLYIDKAIKLTGEQKKILDELAKIGAADYASDVNTLNDVLAAQSELAQLNYDYLLLLELRETEEAKISSILNRPVDSKIEQMEEVTLDFTYSLDELYELFKTNQEELKIIDAGIKKIESEEELSNLSSYPDFNFELMYSEIGTPDGMQPADAGRDSYGVTIGVTLPIWGEKNKSGVREKSLKKRAMLEGRNAHENATESNLKNLYFRLSNAKRLVELYESNLIPQAKTTIAKAEEWYKQNNAGFSELLEAQSVLLNFNLSHQRALADYNKYAVKIYDLVGIELKTKGGEEEK